MDENTIAQKIIFYGCYLELYERRARIHSYPVDCLVGTDVVGIVGAEIKFCRRELKEEKIETTFASSRVCVCFSLSLYITLGQVVCFASQDENIWYDCTTTMPATHTHTHYNAGSTSLSTLFEYMCDRTGCNDIGAANRPIRNTRRPVCPGRRGYGFYVVILHVGTAIWREEKNTFSDKNRKETNSSTARTTAMKQNLLLFSM